MTIALNFKLELKENCIETEAKNKYRELARDLLKEEDKEKEKKLQFLKAFLDNADFEKLRSIGFDGNTEMVVNITKKEDSFKVNRMK